MEVAAAAKRYRIPVAPVRNPVEVMNDPHMHERGMLQRIDHPALGSVVLPNSPLRLHGADPVDPVPSPSLGQHNDQIYGEWLGLGRDNVETLRQAGVI
jgi:crotonobetainyl-CoA:carnitine CoA-transferase CaiB-like acyl-CoA transferase